MTMLLSVLILTIVLILVGTCDAFTASLPPQISNRCLRPPLEQTKDVARHTIPCLHMQLDKTLVAAAVAAVIIAGTVSMDDTAFAESGALHSAQPVVAGIEIVPAGGGGFGGLGISPFGVGPFGGFGFGFGIRPTPEPGVSVRKQGEMPQMSKEEAIQRTKAELEATREREKLLDQRVRELDAVVKQQQS